MTDFVLENIDIGCVPLQTRRFGHVMVDREDRSSWIPVHIVVGARRDPCLALIAGVHGDEYDGIVALCEIVREIDSYHQMGTLIIIPVANPMAFAAARRKTPSDDKDLNRVFPGTPNGTVTERLAHRLCVGILQQADLVFTLHGSQSWGTLIPWVEFLDLSDRTGSATREAALASGFSDLVAQRVLPGVLQTALAAAGIPVIEGEVGGLGEITHENVRFYKDRVLGVARHVGIVDLPHVISSMYKRRIWHVDRVQATTHGIFRRSVELGQKVKSGQSIGEILDVTSGMVTTISAPSDGLVGGHRVHAAVAVGDRLFTLLLPVK